MCRAGASLEPSGSTIFLFLTLSQSVKKPENLHFAGESG